MEDALRDGLAGVGHTEDLDSTRALPGDDATRMLPPTSSGTRARRPLQPLVEDAPPPRRPAPSRRQPAPPAREVGAGKWVALVFVLLVVASAA